jgi:hypothetical protein
MNVDCPHCRQAFTVTLGGGQLALTENFLLQLHEAPSGRLIHEQRIKNMVVDTGLVLMRDLLDETQQGIIEFAIGTGSGATVTGHTALTTEVYRNSVSSRAKVGFDITHRCFIPPTSANGNTLYEAGLFGTSGSLFSRVVHDAIVKTISITATLAWTHTIGRA